MSDPRAGVNWGAGDRKNAAAGPGEALGVSVSAATGTMLPVRQRTNDRLYLHATAQASSNATGVGNLRAVPFVLPNTLTLSHVGLEVVTAGDAGSTVRVAIYGDTGYAYPGSLLIEASGAIDGASATVQELACAVTLNGGTLYWIASVLQNATVVQPTLRILAHPPMAGPTVGGLPAASTNLVGYQQTAVTAALPTTFTTTASTSGVGVRFHIRLA